jgi:Kelch motif protein
MTSTTTKITALAIGALLLSWCHMEGGARATASNSAGRVIVTGSMTAIRFDHAAALLPNSQVLIVGGIERNGVMVPTAELFDPATDRFSQTGKPRSPHGWGVTATVLRDGKVLVAGGSTGCDSPCYTASAELYDPSARTFAPAGGMTVPRAGARALLLPKGDVLFVGGTEISDSDSVATAELYHPSTGTFSPVGATRLPDPSQLLLLKNGEVLVVGASGTDLYDPSTGRFTPSGKMTIPRTKFGAALLPDGKVLVAGGQTGGSWGARVTSTQIYDPTTGKFTPGPELNVKRFKLAMAVVPLKNGRILIAGGADQPEVYDPASGAFIPVAGTKLDGFCFSTATLLNDGTVLLAGGYANPRSPGVNHAWLYQP